jgi:hypothetical protein
MRTALFPSGDGMLNFSAFLSQNSKSAIPAWFLTSRSRTISGSIAHTLRLWQDLAIKFCDYFNRFIQ